MDTITNEVQTQITTAPLAGPLLSWGSNGEGALGDGKGVDTNVPVLVDGLTGIRAIAAGWLACRLMACGGVSARHAVSGDAVVRASKVVRRVISGARRAELPSGCLAWSSFRSWCDQHVQRHRLLHRFAPDGTSRTQFQLSTPGSTCGQLC